ncbi:MAG: GNAT family protein [Thermosynechococcaceae cyanobacterium]
MHFKLASNEHSRVFSEWSQASRLDERTCRPIANGRRIPPENKLVTLTFFVSQVENPVGRFDYFDINVRNRSVEFGYTVNPIFRGQGVGTEMLTLAISYLFSTIDLNKLYCQTAAFNIPSIKLLEKLGFHKDGVLREHHELDGQLWDDCIYSILRDEWQ